MSAERNYVQYLTADGMEFWSIPTDPRDAERGARHFVSGPGGAEMIVPWADVPADVRTALCFEVES